MMRSGATLGELLPDAALASGLSMRAVAHVTADSRSVRAGSLFFAIPGAKSDGLSFARQALEKGAAAVVAERAVAGLGDGLIVVGDVRAALSQAAAVLHPVQPATIAAITGTSGKTSVAAFLRQIWLMQGWRAASLGTIGIVTPDGSVYGSLTTPDPVTLHETLDRLAGEGVTHLAMEASSHGLDQRRLDGVRLSAAAFTNLSRDHLDYHAGFDAYLAAKMRLFEALLKPGQWAVVNADDGVSMKVVEACSARGLRLFTTGLKGANLRLLDSRSEGFSTRITVRHADAVHEVLLPLAGDFQASNALVAAGLAIVTGTPAGAALSALSTLNGAPGRMERVGSAKGGVVIVDYAHKPDALEKALAALRPYTTGRLIVAFGCGGDRDPGKRPMMGEIAMRLADTVIVTDDNPRSEAAAAIRRTILDAAPGALEIADRAAAIRAGIAMLSKGDIFLIAGKGHETGQIVGDTTLPFSDHETARAILMESGA